jgi:hypothetical protein
MAIEQMVAKHIATRHVVDRLTSRLAIRLVYLYIDTHVRSVGHYQRQVRIIRWLLIGSDDACIEYALHASRQLG